MNEYYNMILVFESELLWCNQKIKEGRLDLDNLKTKLENLISILKEEK